MCSYLVPPLGGRDFWGAAAGALSLGRTVIVLRIPGWAELQHYKTRSAPWVKLYVKTLRDPRYRALGLPERGLLADLWRLAVETENAIPDDMGWLAHKLGTDADLQPMLEHLLAGRHIERASIGASISASAALPLVVSPTQVSPSPSQGESEREKSRASHNDNGRERESSPARADFFRTVRELAGHQADTPPDTKRTP